MDYSIRIGGQAGQGVVSIGRMLAKTLALSGLHVFTHQDYMSRIKGGHNFYQIRFSDVPISASRGQVDVLLALDRDTVAFHRHDLQAGGRIICDAETIDPGIVSNIFLDVPFARITAGLGADRIMVNSGTVGAILGAFGFDIDLFAAAIRTLMPEKSEGVIATHCAVARACWSHVRQHYPDLDALKVGSRQTRRQLLISGNQAIGLGALCSGCTFFAAYPMSPATSLMLYLAGQAREQGIIVEQAEDEIAAINLALGASYAGVRAMTATSGGGFALMTEGLSLAGMTETPVVIVEAQRPGPATGLPTRTEQGDLLFVIHGGHGEFPRVVLTPGSPEQAFHLTNKAFHLAEKYQIPVIIQSDQYLADAEWTVSSLAMDTLLYQDFRLREQALQAMPSYRRYARSDTGISPLAVPGASRHVVAVDSDEHDEEGHIIEDAQTRTTMVEKRLTRKMPLIRQEIAPPFSYGDGQEILLIGYSSTYGVMKEAVDHLADRHRIGMLHFAEVCPFPLSEKFDFIALLQQAALTLCVENNATGQFASLLRQETGFTCSAGINKYDGRPFLLDTLIGEINARLHGL